MPSILIMQIFTVFLIGSGLFLLLDKGTVKKQEISFFQTTAKSKRMKINLDVTLSKYEKLVINIDSLLRKIGKDRKYLITIAIFCFIGGTIVGFFCFNGLFLCIATGISFVPLTYLYLMFRTQEATREELAELNNAMSIITNSYLVHNNILRAVETYIFEKNRYIDEKLRKIGPFEEFVTECVYVDRDIDRCLERLSVKISNKYFQQWVKNIRLCVENREMRFTLQPVVDAMDDEKIMQLESDSQMWKTWQTYFFTVIIMFAVILVFRISREEWFLILTKTIIGQFIIILMLLAALLSAVFVMRINKPISTI